MRLFWKGIANLLIVLVFYSIASIGTALATGSGQGNDRGIFLTLYKEKHQNAFHMLIPKGWKAEGGMIPSGVSWNVVDLVENNIRFRVTSPDGKSFFGWYPRFYFQDPQVIIQSSGAMLKPVVGSRSSLPVPAIDRTSATRAESGSTLGAALTPPEMVSSSMGSFMLPAGGSPRRSEQRRNRR